MTAPTIIPIDPADTEAWLAQRRQGIGSSDVAAILGMSHFASAYSTWVDKVEGLPNEDSDAMRWGRKLEAVVADEFSECHPEFTVWKPNVMYAHPERPYMQANPDRLLFLGNGGTEGDHAALLEIKTSNWTEDWEDGPPDYVLLQVQHQLAVMDLPYAFIALLMFGREYREWRVERDERTLALLFEHEAEFWRRVTERDPPPVDGSDATTDALKAFYADATDDEVEGGDDAAELLRLRAELKVQAADVGGRLDEVENRLKALFGSRSRLLIGGEAAASWSQVVQQRVDMKALEADYPEIVEKYRQPSSFRRLSVKKGWK